jgi:hypothetical protein
MLLNLDHYRKSVASPAAKKKKVSGPKEKSAPSANSKKSALAPAKTTASLSKANNIDDDNDDCVVIILMLFNYIQYKILFDTGHLGFSRSLMSLPKYCTKRCQKSNHAF